MGKASRDKGSRGELEVVQLAISHGLDARRTAQMQTGQRGYPDVSLTLHPEYHIEVKRDERLSVDAMWRQATNDALSGRIPILAYRRNRQDWRGQLPLNHLFDLIGNLG